MVKVSVSVLNVPEDNAVSMFYNLETAKVDYFHIDVMDGKFVENNNLSQMKEYALTLSHITNIGLDVHLMVQENLEKVIDDYIDLEPEIITFHYEVVKGNNDRLLEIVKELQRNNVKVGLAISPETDVQEIMPLCKYMHQILIMTVVPGKGGQKFIPEMADKIKTLKEYLDKNDLPCNIEVDGGINDKTSKIVIDAGANVLVSGNYILSSENYKDSVKNLRGIE